MVMDGNQIFTISFIPRTTGHQMKPEKLNQKSWFLTQQRADLCNSFLKHIVGARVDTDSRKDWMTIWKRDYLGLLNRQATGDLGNSQNSIKWRLREYWGKLWHKFACSSYSLVSIYDRCWRQNSRSLVWTLPPFQAWETLLWPILT